MTLRLVWTITVVIGALDLGWLQAGRPRFKLQPIDEAVQVPAFKAYRDALQEAVVARDGDRVLAMMHPEIAQGGLEMVLRSTTEAVGGQEHQAWTALDALLRLGGTFTKGSYRVLGSAPQHATQEFSAPYVWSTYPLPMPYELVRQSQADPWVVLG